MKELLIITVFSALLSSCAVHQGTISSSSFAKKVKYEDMAFGVAQTNTFLGIGGISKDALVLEGKCELVKSRPLKANEEYANFSIDFKRTYFPLGSQTKVTVCADVVNFQNDTLTDPYSELYKKKLFTKRLVSDNLFQVGDSIIDKNAITAIIIGIEDVNKVRILYRSKNGQNRTKKIGTNKIYATNKRYKGILPGEVNQYELYQSSSPKVLGVGLKKYIINKSGYIEQRKYN
ncbi:MAG: DUF6567 family protein [Salinivirgaceae bacterium]